MASSPPTLSLANQQATHSPLSSILPNQQLAHTPYLRVKPTVPSQPDLEMIADMHARAVATTYAPFLKPLPFFHLVNPSMFAPQLLQPTTHDPTSPSTVSISIPNPTSPPRSSSPSSSPSSRSSSPSPPSSSSYSSASSSSKLKESQMHPDRLKVMSASSVSNSKEHARATSPRFTGANNQVMRPKITPHSFTTSKARKSARMQKQRTPFTSPRPHRRDSNRRTSVSSSKRSLKIPHARKSSSSSSHGARLTSREPKNRTRKKWTETQVESERKKKKLIVVKKVCTDSESEEWTGYKIELHHIKKREPESPRVRKRRKSQDREPATHRRSREREVIEISSDTEIGSEIEATRYRSPRSSGRFAEPKSEPRSSSGRKSCKRTSHAHTVPKFHDDEPLSISSLPPAKPAKRKRSIEGQIKPRSSSARKSCKRTSHAHTVPKFHDVEPLSISSLPPAQSAKRNRSIEEGEIVSDDDAISVLSESGTSASDIKSASSMDQRNKSRSSEHDSSDSKSNTSSEVDLALDALRHRVRSSMKKSSKISPEELEPSKPVDHIKRQQLLAAIPEPKTVLSPEEIEAVLTKHGLERHMSILVLGDGNVSFSCSLARLFGTMSGMLYVTTLDSEKELLRKYESAQANLDYLRSLPWARVCPSTDAKKLRHDFFGGQLFDCVIWNFPHTGANDEDSNVELLGRFLNRVRDVLRPKGQVHLRLCNGQESTWGLSDLAFAYGFHCLEKSPFSITDFPGYERRKIDDDSGWNINWPTTMRFVLKVDFHPRGYTQLTVQWLWIRKHLSSSYLHRVFPDVTRPLAFWPVAGKFDAAAFANFEEAAVVARILALVAANNSLSVAVVSSHAAQVRVMQAACHGEAYPQVQFVDLDHLGKEVDLVIYSAVNVAAAASASPLSLSLSSATPSSRAMTLSPKVSVSIEADAVTSDERENLHAAVPVYSSMNTSISTDTPIPLEPMTKSSSMDIISGSQTLSSPLPADLRRLLIRACSGLIVVGNPLLLQQDVGWDKWLQWMHAHNFVVKTDEKYTLESARRALKVSDVILLDEKASASESTPAGSKDGCLFASTISHVVDSSASPSETSSLSVFPNLLTEQVKSEVITDAITNSLLEVKEDSSHAHSFATGSLSISATTAPPVLAAPSVSSIPPFRALSSLATRLLNRKKSSGGVAVADFTTPQPSGSLSLADAVDTSSAPSVTPAPA